MCTVSFLPKKGNSFILTSNRDEDMLRQTALPFQKYSLNNKSLYYPKDPKAGGTWIATEPNSFTVCLLNGAFKAHTPNPPYNKSRGIVLLDFFKYNNQYDFIKQYDFSNIEPFTLLFVKRQQDYANLNGMALKHTI
jgi:uncharacterized protein with NRDE domain